MIKETIRSHEGHENQTRLPLQDPIYQQASSQLRREKNHQTNIGPTFNPHLLEARGPNQLWIATVVIPVSGAGGEILQWFRVGTEDSGRHSKRRYPEDSGSHSKRRYPPLLYHPTTTLMRICATNGRIQQMKTKVYCPGGQVYSA